jgi:hypothetical protein
MESPIRFLKLHLYSSALISLLAFNEVDASSRYDDQRYAPQNSATQKAEQTKIKDGILKDIGNEILQKRQECTRRSDCLQLFQAIVQEQTESVSSSLRSDIVNKKILDNANNEAFSTEEFLFSKLSETAKTNFQNGYRVAPDVINMRTPPKHLNQDDVIILLIEEIGKVSSANQPRQASLDRDIRIIESVAQKLPSDPGYTPLLGTFGPEIRQLAEEKTPIHSTFRALKDNMSVKGWDAFKDEFNTSVAGKYDATKLLKLPKEKWRTFSNNGKPLVFVNPITDAPKTDAQAEKQQQVDKIKDQGTALASQLFAGLGTGTTQESNLKDAKTKPGDKTPDQPNPLQSALGGVDFGSLLSGLNKK